MSTDSPRRAARHADHAQRTSGGRRALEVLWLILGLVGVTAVVGGVVAVLGATVFSPQAAAQAYAQAIADGRLDDASKAAASGSTPVGGDALSDPANRISDVQVGSATVAGATATVPVSYTLQGTTHTATLSLAHGNGAFALITPWTVATPLTVQVMVNAVGPQAVAFNGVAVATADGAAVASLYPGVYSVDVPSTDPYYTAPPTQVVAASDAAPASLTLATAPTDALKQAVDDQLTQMLATCAASTSINPPGCPWGTHLDVVFQKLTWKIAKQPVYEVNADGTAFRTVSAGKAVAHYQQRLSYWVPWSAGSTSVKISFSGTIGVMDGTVVVTPDP